MPTQNQRHCPTLDTRARRVLALAAVAAALLLAVPAADAATYCVGSPTGCSGAALEGNSDALQHAFDLAASNGEVDTVRIGAGTYTHPDPGGWVIDNPAEGIEVRGEGPTETILEGSGSSATTLTLAGAGQHLSSVRDLGVRLSAGGGTPIGLVVGDGRARNVAVAAPAGATAGLGVRLAGSTALFDQGSVNTPGLRGIEATGEAAVQDSSIVADVALRSTGGILGLAHSTIETGRVGILSTAPLYVFDSLIRVNDGPAVEHGILGTATVGASHLTIVGSGNPTYGLRAHRQGGGSASHKLDNSTVTGFDNDLAAGSDGLSLASISVDYSNYSSAVASAGGAIDPGYGNVDFAPGFADPAGGNFHLRHDSPLLDLGRDMGWDVDTDLDHLPRSVNGDGAGDAQPDIGAYEYQRAVPVAAISGPDSAAVGETLQVSGAGSSDKDRGDALTYAWWFGDGTTASGETASHAYAAAGTYPVTLQVTDPTGQQATITKSVSVQAGSGGTVGGGTVGGGTVSGGETADSVAPVIKRLRTARMGKAIRFRLSETARVTLRFTRIGTGRLVRRLRLSGARGANEVRVRGRLARALRPGRYRVTASARDAAGNQAHRRTVRLVLPPS